MNGMMLFIKIFYSKISIQAYETLNITKTSKTKTSKLYKKVSVGQG